MPASPSCDVLIVGAGHNGLVCAAVLAQAGWRVHVVERNERVGGAIQSGELTLPGFEHDVWSTNQNLFRSGPAWAHLQDDLQRHGFRFAASDKPVCNVFPDGTMLGLPAGLDEARAAVAAHSEADAAGWDRLAAHFEDFQRAFLPLYGMPLPSLEAVAALGKAAATVGPGRLNRLARLLMGSTRELADAFFATPEMKALIATWGLHLDFGPDVSGGAVFPLMETFSNAAEGMVIAEGGAQRLVEALAAIVREHDGAVQTGRPVEEVLVEGGRAVGVRLASGETLRAERAVVANLTPHVLFGSARRPGLVPAGALPDDFRREVDGFQHGPATLMLHLALDGPAPWRAEAARDFAYVHVAPYVDDLARTYTHALNGALPDTPLLIVGQTTAVDAGRAPAGKHILWVQVRTVPSAITGDAAGEIAATTWAEAAAPFVERCLDKLEAYAPGLRARLLGQRVYTPDDLEAHNPNLVGGDSIGGSMHLRQNFHWRPVPGWSRYRTPVDALWMVGAATWPGPGNNGASGYLAAQDLRWPEKVKPWALGAGALATALGAGALAVRD